MTIACTVVLSGCASQDHAPAGSVAAAWERQGRTEASPARADDARPVAKVANGAREDATSDPPIATVDGRRIPRNRVVDLLLRSHGASALEQLIGLETAATAATKKGLTITQTDVGREYDRALRRLADPLSPVTPQTFDRKAARRLLETVLVQRNISREEFDLIMRRNAHLRKIVESEQVFTEEQLRREFRRVYGKRVRVRHIQLATLREVEQVKERLADGEGFGELAARYSANTASAKANGLLDPFSAEDEELPALFRQVAFTLKPGEVSSAVRVGEWYYLIKMEKLLPPENRDFEQVRGELERTLRERVTDPAMFQLFEKLFQQATIQIHDPVLKEAFDKKHPDRVR
ncbi:MAG: peptidylprolyl isomerase [Phycisphaerae bacterium]